MSIAHPDPLVGLLDAIKASPSGGVPCLDPDPEVRRRWTSDRLEDAKLAMAGCAGCPVRTLCRQVGMPEHSGVWGGLYHREGRGGVLGPARRLVPIPCGWCGRVFQPRRSSSHYCSRECAGRASHEVATP